MISDLYLYLYWVSVFLRMLSFTVRFKTRIHLTYLFWFSIEFSFSVFHRTTIMVLPIYKCAFRHPLINIIYVHDYGYVPKAACYVNVFVFSSKTLSSASSNSHAFDSVEIWYLQTSPLACYRYFGHFHSFSF